MLGPNSLQICQSPRRDSDDFARLLEQGVPLGLDCLQLGDDKLEPVEFASDLSFEMVRQDAAVARLQGVQARSAVAMERFVVEDALGEQKAFDAVNVFYPLSQHRPAFATNPASVLLLASRRPDHGAYSRSPAFVRQKRANQGFAVNCVGLGSPASP